MNAADATRRRTYLGQNARIVRCYRLRDGRQIYALKTTAAKPAIRSPIGVLAVSADKRELIDLAEACYLTLTSIADENAEQ
ncbi:MAG: hypothetical protein ACOC46_00115 [Pirellulales bacterium]